MNAARLLGVTIGVLIGIVIVIAFFKFSNKDGRIKSEYDEMKNYYRGLGYKYAFYTVLIYLAIVTVLDIGEIPLHMSFSNICFVGIFLGVMVDVWYCIRHNAYFGLNNNVKRYGVLMTICTVINFLAAFAAIKGGRMMRDGELQPPFVNLLCGIMFLAVAIAMFMNKNKGETS